MVSINMYVNTHCEATKNPVKGPLAHSPSLRPLGGPCRGAFRGAAFCMGLTTLYRLEPILCRKRSDVTMLLHFHVICVYVFLRYFQTVVISYGGRTRQMILQTFSK